MSLVSRPTGAYRKLTLVAVCFLVVGWLLYLTGFCWELLAWTGEIDAEQEYTSRNMSKSDPSLFPYYIALIGGPFLCLLEVLHAILPGVTSCIFGAMSMSVSTIYFISVGGVALRSGSNITNILNERSQFPYPNVSVSPRVVLRFSGALIEGLSWMIISLIVSLFYNYHPENLHRHKKWPLSLGYARIASITCITLSVIAWCVYIVGEHSVLTHAHGNGSTRGLYSLNDAGTFFIPPLLFVAALLHASCAGDAGNMIGVLVSILNVLYLTFMGSVMISYSLLVFVYQRCSDYSEEDCVAVKRMLGGSIAGLFFWTIALALWPFYYKQRSVKTFSQEQSYVQNDGEQPYETQPLIQNM